MTADRQHDLDPGGVLEDLEARVRFARQQWVLGGLLPPNWIKPLFMGCGAPHPSHFDGWGCNLHAGHIGRHMSARRDHTRSRYVVRASWEGGPGGWLDQLRAMFRPAMSADYVLSPEFIVDATLPPNEIRIVPDRYHRPITRDDVRRAFGVP